MLDEGLAVVDGLLRGETVRHRGEYYTVEDVALDPPPRQQPRPAIWVGGESPPALRRAARWDGWIVGGDNEYGEMIRSPERIAEEIAYLRDHRDRDEPVTVAMTGVSATDDSDLFDAYTHAGVDWWLESIHGMRGSVEEMVGRIKAGPPAPAQGG
jgi:alkanesulfonate monooxygenase SsuD/methylene tetrahydromethanopterin reductase-like flavin-dependent oxidoreductase (luciferase family)